MFLDEVEDSRDIVIPKNPIDRIIGQTKAIEKVKIAVKQRRHLLLVGPPGVGKSMIAQALALSLPRPNQEIRLLHCETDPDRPILEVVTREDIAREAAAQKPQSNLVTPMDVPYHVAVQLGFRCSSCSAISSDKEMVCPNCGVNKYASRSLAELSPFTDIMAQITDSSYIRPEKEVSVLERGRTTIYRKVEGGKIEVIDSDAIQQQSLRRPEKRKRILIPINRLPFVQATGASETELLGDVRHDPYGSHPEIGTPAYMRVVAGAIHEAHEGVLFIDELPQIQHLQTYILTAMQEKKFPIVGRNPHSAGASVKVADVPCDFVFVGACNIGDLEKIMPPLRSRILGGGYEILLDTTMPDTEENRFKLAQFVAQEIEADGKIPPASRESIEEIINEAKRRAALIDNARGALTLRLRDLGGLIRYAGDLAKTEESPLIEAKHVKRALTEAKTVEQQIKESYGSIWGGINKGDRGSGGFGKEGSNLYR